MNFDVNIDKAKISMVVMDDKWFFVRCFFGTTYLHYDKTHIGGCYAPFQQQLVLNCVLRISWAQLCPVESSKEKCPEGLVKIG